jgi:hypothetical protein
MGADYELAVRAAERYMAQLAGVAALPAASQHLIAVTEELRATLAVAVEKGPMMSADDVTFSAGMVEPLLVSGEWRYLLNPWTLGFGSDRPRVLALGTEGAMEPSSALGVWEFASATVTLTEGSRRVLAKLVQGLDRAWTDAVSPPGAAPYHRNLYEFLRRMGVQAVDEPRHTWTLLSRALGPGPVDDRGDPNRIWQDAYLIERSAIPAKMAVGGSAPTPNRVAFLCELVTAFRETARVLVIYGHTDPKAYAERPDGDLWAWTNRELTKTFLGVDRLEPPTQVDTEDDQSSKHRSLGVWRVGNRLALWTWALSGRNVTNAYIRTVRAQVDAR